MAGRRRAAVRKLWGVTMTVVMSACGQGESPTARPSAEVVEADRATRPAPEPARPAPAAEEPTEEDHPVASPAPEASPAAPPEVERSVTALHQAAIVIDTHNDVTLRMVDEPGFDFGQRSTKGHTDLVRMREGGLDAQFLSVWVNPRDYGGEAAWQRSLDMFAAIHRAAKGLPDDVVLCRSTEEVRATAAAGKVAFLIGVEGAHALGEFTSDDEALRRIERWYDLGARYLTLTWTNINKLGGASGGPAGRKMGMTPLGKRAVERMNELGMMVDLSHVSDPMFFDALAATTAPVIASHSGVRALHDHHRNLSDDMLRAIAKNGGAVCVVYYPAFLDGAFAAGQRKARRSGGENEAAPVTVGRVVDHIEHAVKVAGVDHVCLGSDFDGIGSAPVGLEDVSKLPNLTAELRRRGHSDGDIQKILGENVLRVFSAVEARARRRGAAEEAPTSGESGE